MSTRMSPKDEIQAVSRRARWVLVASMVVLAIGIAYVFRGQLGVQVAQRIAEQGTPQLLAALERALGMQVQLQDVQLDAARGLVHGRALRLTRVPAADALATAPLLTARGITLQIDPGALARGDVVVSSATLEGAILSLVVREGRVVNAPELVSLGEPPWRLHALSAPGARVEIDAGELGTAVLQHVDLTLTAERAPARLHARGEQAAVVVESAALGALTLAAELDAKLAWAPRQGSSLQLALRQLQVRGPGLELAGAATLDTRETPALQLSLERVVVGDLALGEATGKLAVEAGQLVLTDVRAQRERSTLRASRLALLVGPGAAPWLAGTFELEDVALSELASALELEPAVLSGLEARTHGSLTLGAPDGGLQAGVPGVLGAALELRELRRGDRRIDGALRAVLAERGRVPQGSCPGAVRALERGQVGGGRAWLVCGEMLGRQLRVDLAVGGGAGAPVRGSIDLRGFELSQLLPESTVRGTVDASLALTAGGLVSATPWAASGRVSALSAHVEALHLTSQAPFDLRIAQRRATPLGATLLAGSVPVALSGSVHLDEGFALDAAGSLSLAPLVRELPWVQSATGMLDVHATLRGPLRRPVLEARAEPREAALQLEHWPTPLAFSQGALVLDGAMLRLQDARTELGKAGLRIDGELALQDARVQRAALRMRLDRIALSPQPKVELAFSADTTLHWTRGDALPTLRGELALEHFLYARQLQLPEAIFAMTGDKAAPTQRAQVALDLRLRPTRPMRVRNSFLDAELIEDAENGGLRLIGTDAQPLLLGSLQIRGRAVFRNNELTIRAARVSFSSREALVPQLELRADAPARRRSGARIELHAHGDPARFALELRCQASDPSATPPPFACSAVGASMRCDDLAQLATLWACEPPGKPSTAPRIEAE